MKNRKVTKQRMAEEPSPTGGEGTITDTALVETSDRRRERGDGLLDRPERQ